MKICANSWQISTTNLTNLTNNHLALVKGEDGALGALGALRELRVIAQPIQPSTPPVSVRFPTHNEISEICGICVSQVLHQGVRTQKRRAPRLSEMHAV